MKKLSSLLFTSVAASLLLLAGCAGGGTHTHTFADTWTSNESQHWHAATCEHTDQKSDVSAHTFGDDFKCTVCGYLNPHMVTSQEWMASFGLEGLPYYISNNYKGNASFVSGGVTATAEYTIDGSKLKIVRTEGTESDEEFFNCVGQTYFEYVNSQGKWSLQKRSSNPIFEIVVYFEAVSDASKFTFDVTDNTYKAESYTIGQTPIKNAKVKFDNKKLVYVSYESAMPGEGESLIEFTFTSSLVYGNQQVNVPQITYEEGYGFVLNEGIPMELNSQTLSTVLELQTGSHLKFVHFTSQGAVEDLTNLTLSEPSKKYGFGLNQGLLSSILNGRFEFVLDVESTTPTLTINDRGIACPYYGEAIIDGEEPYSGPFSFRRVEEGVIYYSIATPEIPAVVSDKFVLKINAASGPVKATLAEGGASELFTINEQGDTLTCKGYEGTKSFMVTLKEVVVNNELSIQIDYNIG